MTIKVTLEFATAAEARAALAALDSAEVNRADDTARASLQAKRDAVKAAKPKAPKEEAPAKVEQAEPEPAAEAPTVDYPTVQASILKVANAKGRDRALEILGTFGAKTGKELKPEQYDAALAAFTAALEA